MQKTAEELMISYQMNSPEEAYSAFVLLYGRYSGRVFQYLNAKTRNAADTEDLLQKVFFKIHDSKHLYKEKFTFEQWLFVIARTTLLDHFRSHKRHTRKIELLNEKLVTEYALNCLGDESDFDLGFLEALPKEQQEMLNLKFIDELSYLEMATVLGKSEVSLRKSLSRLLGKLKKDAIYE